MAFAPDQLLALQQDYMRALSELWSDFLQHPEKTTAPIKDGRFADPAWQRNPTAALTARAYLLNAQFMNKLADTVQGDKKTRDRVKFAVSQFVDAAAPSNFLALNPQAQQRMLDTKGESLTAGMQNLLGDIGRGDRDVCAKLLKLLHCLACARRLEAAASGQHQLPCAALDKPMRNPQPKAAKSTGDQDRSIQLRQAHGT